MITEKDYPFLINQCKFWLSDKAWDYEWDGADPTRHAQEMASVVLDLLDKLGVDTSTPYNDEEY